MTEKLLKAVLFVLSVIAFLLVLLLFTKAYPRLDNLEWSTVMKGHCTNYVVIERREGEFLVRAIPAHDSLVFESHSNSIVIYDTKLNDETLSDYY